MSQTNNSGFLREWKKEQREILKSIYPNATKKEMNKYLDDVISEKLTNPYCQIHNNYIHSIVNTNLLAVIDWVKATKPICGGHGVFYMNQHKINNPIAKMIIGFLTSRKILKKQMFMVKDVSSDEYKDLDRGQGNEKIMANSIYGSLGQWSSFIHNVYTAPSVTGTGQSLISTTCCAFEAFLTNSVKFHSIDECFTFINNITHEKFKIDPYFLNSIPVEKLVDRLINMFSENGESHRYILTTYLSTFDQDMINRIYYKNNLYEFSELYWIKSLLIDILQKVDTFKDPGNIPSEIDKELKELWKYYKEFVLYNHFFINRIDRLKNDYRETTVTIDTDSNMLNINPWRNYLKETIIDLDKNVSQRDENELKFVSINIMAYIITQVITTVLNKYTEGANVPEDYRHYINMKNEFLFSRIILAFKKKKYVTSVRLREGNEIFPEKVDIKGYEFMKSSATEQTKEYYRNMINRRMLQTDDISIKDILTDLDNLEKIIRTSLANKERDYLTPASVKIADGYKEGMAMRILGFRSVMIWNEMYPELSVDLPTKIDVVKLKLDDRNMKLFETKYPEDFAKFNSLILNHRDETIRRKYANIAVPRGLENIPEWIIEFIDYDTIVFDVLKKIYPVIQSLDVNIYNINSTTPYYSNIISI